MDFTKCELIQAIKRKIDAARKAGKRWVSLPLEDLLLAMQYDQRGGMDQLEAVLEDMRDACNCKSMMENKDHRKVVTFAI